MSSVPVLRDFIRERLSAAAEEIFSAFERTLVQYEEEMDQHRTLLDNKPELPHRGPCQALKEVLLTQNSYYQETNPHLDMDPPGPSPIKEEQDDFCTSQEEEQLELKQESDTFMMPPVPPHKYMENDFSETAAKLLLPPDSAIAEIQDQKQFDKLDLGSFTKADLLSKNNENSSPGDSVQKSSLTVIHNVSHIRKKTAICDICGKSFQYQSQLKKHRRTHTGEKPYPCERCGKSFRTNSHLLRHSMIHTDDKPDFCKICRKGFICAVKLKNHMLTHTNKRLYSCEVCGKGCTKLSSLKVHARTHTGEKPYFCQTCGRRFNDPSSFKRHVNRHKDIKLQSGKQW